MNKKYWNKEKIELLKAYSANPTLSIQDIAKKLKVSYDAVEHAQRRYNITQEYIKSKTVSIKQANQLLDIKPINWKIVKSNKLIKNERPFKTYIISADYHVPYEDEASVKVLLQVTKDLNPDGFILLGDFLDFEPISHWLKNKKKTLENKRMQSDYQAGNQLLDEFDKLLPKNCDKRFFWGNHEKWYYDLIEEMPSLEGLLNPDNELKLKERGYKIYNDINHIERIGRLCFVHGIYHNENYVKAHLDKFQTNVFHADMHSPRFQCAESPAREIALVGYCVGCMCNLSPSYMQNRPNKWSHGFAVVYFYDNGFFDVDLKRIVKGKCVFNGKMYDGNTK
jgi:transposase